MKAITNLKDNWPVLVTVAILTVLGNMVFRAWADNREADQGKASIEYVDEKNRDQDVLIDQRCESFDARISTNESAIKYKVDKDEFNKAQDQVNADLNYIRSKTDKIYEILINKQ